MKSFKRFSYLLFSAATFFTLLLGAFYLLVEATWTIMILTAIISYSFAMILWFTELWSEGGFKGLREQDIRREEQRELMDKIVALRIQELEKQITQK